MRERQERLRLTYGELLLLTMLLDENRSADTSLKAKADQLLKDWEDGKLS